MGGVHIRDEAGEVVWGWGRSFESQAEELGLYIWIMVEGYPEKFLGQRSNVIAWCLGILKDHSGGRYGMDGGDQGWGIKIKNVMYQVRDFKI